MASFPFMGGLPPGFGPMPFPFTAHASAMPSAMPSGVPPSAMPPSAMPSAMPPSATPSPLPEHLPVAAFQHFQQKCPLPHQIPRTGNPKWTVPEIIQHYIESTYHVHCYIMRVKGVEWLPPAFQDDTQPGYTWQPHSHIVGLWFDDALQAGAFIDFDAE